MLQSWGCGSCQWQTHSLSSEDQDTPPPCRFKTFLRCIAPSFFFRCVGKHYHPGWVCHRWRSQPLAQAQPLHLQQSPRRPPAGSPWRPARRMIPSDLLWIFSCGPTGLGQWSSSAGGSGADLAGVRCGAPPNYSSSLWGVPTVEDPHRMGSPAPLLPGDLLGGGSDSIWNLELSTLDLVTFFGTAAALTWPFVFSTCNKYIFKRKKEKRRERKKKRWVIDRLSEHIVASLLTSVFRLEYESKKRTYQFWNTWIMNA